MGRIFDRAVLLLLLLLAPVTGWPLGPVRFGAEFTFYNPEVGPIEDEDPKKRIVPGGDRVIQRMKDHLIDGQPDGAKFTFGPPRLDTRQSNGRFTSPNGWWFEFGYDDSVLEIKTIPESPEYYRRYMSDMQDAIFVSAGNEGLWPAMFMGGGHINLGLEAFDGNPLLLRNFIVDTMLNHNELFLGVFNYDTHNAASIYVQSDKVQRVVRNIIKGFDEGDYTGIDGSKKFLQDLHVAMNLETDECFEHWRTGGTRQCYFAVNLSHYSAGEASRIEFRAVRPQTSMDMWVRQIDLLHKRLLLLEKLKSPIPIRPRVKVAKLDFSPDVNHLLNPPVKPQEALKAFYIYVTEAGADWADHRDYLWPQWISSGELAKFEKSLWFRNRELRRCESLLKK